MIHHDSQGSRIELRHLDLQPEHLTDCSAGWHSHLDLLQDLASGREARDFWLRYSEVREEYAKRYAEA